MPRATLSIASAPPGITISPGLFGGFIEHFHRIVYGGIFDPGSPLADDRGFRQDVMDAVRELKVPVVRWPGGCFASGYHWVDGVGPDRQPHYDLAWRVSDPNRFGTAEFIAWCERIGAEPYICTNAGTGGPEEMAAWLEYCNSTAGGRWDRLRRQHGAETPYGVPWWSIGNENYGAWEIGAKGAGEWARLVTESAKAMRRVDPTVRLLTAARADLDWTLPLVEAAGDLLDGVSIHGYFDSLKVVDAPSPYLTCLRQALEPEADIRRTRAIIAAAGFEGKLTIAYDEWNLRGWHHPWTGANSIAARDRNDRHQTYTMADAVFTAGFLNSCVRQADIVTMANVAPLVNGRGPIYAGPDGLVKRTTFHVLSLYANHLGRERLDALATSPDLDCGDGVTVPAIDAVATRDGGDLTIAAVNRDPAIAHDLAVDIDRRPLTGTAARWTLEGDSPDAFNDPAHPERVAPATSQVDVTAGLIHLPPHSVTLLTLPYQGAEPLAGAWHGRPTAGWHRT
jgi:alpha-N-arabinofuranosidase